MRSVVAVIACVALVLAACNPVTTARYYREGPGVDLYQPELPSQTQLLEQYVRYICDQADLVRVVGAQDSPNRRLPNDHLKTASHLCIAFLSAYLLADDD